MASGLRHALVLTAGLGTRLRPLTLVRAKPAIPLAGEPIVRRIIRWLASQGATELVLNLHYRPDSITALLGDGQGCGVRVRYSWEQPLLGSAGGPRLAAPILGTETFLLINGDTLTDLDLGALTDDHLASGALVTMALVPNVDPAHYGGVRLDERGRVLGFARRGSEAVGTYHFIGVQVASAAAFDSVPLGSAARSVGDVYDRLIASRAGSVRGFVSPVGFWDIGTVADYWRTSLELAADRDRLGGGDLHIATDATVRRSIIWDRVSVGSGARVEGCILTDDVTVPAGASYLNAILMMGEKGLVAAPMLAEDPRR